MKKSFTRQRRIEHRHLTNIPMEFSLPGEVQRKHADADLSPTAMQAPMTLPRAVPAEFSGFPTIGNL
jgi:hypothetical protein